MGVVRRSAAVVVAGVLLVLAACGGENPAARPVELKEPTWDSGSEPSDGGGKSDGGGEATKAVPDIPPPDPKDFPGMDQKTDEGAEQAARYFLHVTYWAHQTDGLAKYDALILEDCQKCQAIREDIQGRGKARSFWSKTEVALGVCSLMYSEQDLREYHCYTTLSPHFEPAFPGEPAEDVGKLELATGVQLKWVDRKWLVSGYAVVK